MIDRPMRPLFPKDFRNDVQLVATVVSADQEQDPTTLAVTGASLALQISDIPHAGPVGCVRVGMLDGQLILNPTLQQLQESDLDLVVAGTADAITMVEAGARQIAEPTMLQALRLAHDEIKRLVEFQLQVRATLGAKPVMDYPRWAVAPEITDAVHTGGRKDASPRRPATPTSRPARPRSTPSARTSPPPSRSASRRPARRSDAPSSPS